MSKVQKTTTGTNRPQGQKKPSKANTLPTEETTGTVPANGANTTKNAGQWITNSNNDKLIKCFEFNNNTHGRCFNILASGPYTLFASIDAQYFVVTSGTHDTDKIFENLTKALGEFERRAK